MAKRGRPRHPDILTPREWDVLALIREGLTNEQIAERLDITERTARFHVSEILRKLGVSSRHEAAAWQPEEKRPWWSFAFVPLSFGKAHRWLATGIGVTVIGTAVVGVALLIWGLMRTDGEALTVAAESTPTLAQPSVASNRPTPVASLRSSTIVLRVGTPGPTRVVVESATPAATPRRTGLPIVDQVIEAVEQKNSEALQALLSFTDVACETNPPVSEAFTCPPGISDGSLIPAITYLACVGRTWQPGVDLSPLLEPFSTASSQVYAVYAGGELRSEAPAEYVVMLAYPGPESTAGLGILVNATGVIGFDTQCGFAPERLAELSGYGEAILPPLGETS